MAIQITRVKPSVAQFSDPIEAHVRMEFFSWVNENSGQAGETSREGMYEWIVNKKGRAYVKNPVTHELVYVFGAIDPNGRRYIRTAEKGKWTDILIELEKLSATPPSVQ